MKLCIKCNEYKEYDDFYLRKDNNRYDSWCKICKSEWSKEYIQSDKALKTLFYQRVRNIKTRTNFPIMENLRDHLIDLWNKQDGKCYYTGLKMDLRGYSSNKRESMTIDRKDSSKGYVEGNVVLCCSIINKMKQDLTIDELLEFCYLISKNKNNGK